MKKKVVFGRRGFLKAAGATTVIVAGGTVWRAFDQGVFSTGQGPTYEPWETWRTDTNWQALMPFRIGYQLRESLPSPRRSAEDVIV
jgi:hypothetical protein